MYFLGQPLYKVDNLNSEEYLDMLQHIFTYYRDKNKKVKYITHRAEDKKIIEKIKKIKHINIEIINLSMPFELYLLKNNIRIKYLTSFVSTGLFSIKTIYPSIEVSAFYFTAFRKDIKNTNDYLYKMMEHHNIDVIRDYIKS